MKRFLPVGYRRIHSLGRGRGGIGLKEKLQADISGLASGHGRPSLREVKSPKCSTAGRDSPWAWGWMVPENNPCSDELNIPDSTDR